MLPWIRLKRLNKEVSRLYAGLLSHMDDDMQTTYMSSASEISPKVLLLCHPHIVCTSSACGLRRDFILKKVSTLRADSSAKNRSMIKTFNWKEGYLVNQSTN